MKNQPKLILLNGFAGSGKTTLAKRYIDDHPLALQLEGDEIIVKLGQWRQHSDEAVRCKLALTESMVRTHLTAGYNVVLPFLLVDATHAKTYETIAHEADAKYFEVYLNMEKDDAVNRLLKRGTWGEAGLPPLTETDRPRIEKLYDDMISATNTRPDTVRIHPVEANVESTYREFLKVVT